MPVYNPHKLKGYTTTPIAANRFLSLKKGTVGKVFDDALLFTDDYQPTTLPGSSYSFRELAKPKYAPNIETVIEDTYRVFMLNPNTTSILSIINITNNPITVMGRDGVKRVMPSLALDGTSEGVIFRKIYCFNRKDANLNRWFDSLKHDQAVKDNVESFKEAKLIAKIYDRSDAIITQLNQHVIVVVDFFVPSEDIHHLGLIYLSDLDISMCFEESGKLLTHPYFNREASVPFKAEVGGVSTLSYRVVDNCSSISKKFFYAGGEVITIVPSVDLTLADGVYKTTISDGKMKTVYFPLDECEKLGLYSTIEEAKTLGNPSIQKEKELEELKHFNRLLEIENGKTKAELETTTLNNKTELESLRYAVEKTKLDESMERDKIKAEYESLLRQNKLDFESRERRVKMEHDDQMQRMKEDEQLREAVREEEAYRRKAEYEQAQQARKDQYEKEHYERKNYYEKETSKQDTMANIIKTVAVVISTVLSIIAISLKFFVTKAA